MSSYYGKDFDHTCRYLIRNLNCKFPVKIRTVTTEQMKRLCKKAFAGEKDSTDPVYAICTFDETNTRVKSATIYIIRGLSVTFAEWQLVHELAHVIQKGGEKAPHGNAWGIAYSKLYKIYTGENGE